MASMRYGWGMSKEEPTENHTAEIRQQVERWRSVPFTTPTAEEWCHMANAAHDWPGNDPRSDEDRDEISREIENKPLDGLRLMLCDALRLATKHRAELLAELDALRAGPDAAELEALRVRVRMLEAEQAEAVRLGLIPNHPLTFGPGDNNVGRACLCGVSIPAGCRYAHAAWCRGSTRTRARSIEEAQAELDALRAAPPTTYLRADGTEEPIGELVERLTRERDTMGASLRDEVTARLGAEERAEKAEARVRELEAGIERAHAAQGGAENWAETMTDRANEAERKLEETRAQLARLRDVIAKTEAQIAWMYMYPGWRPVIDALRAALSTPGHTMAEIRRAAQVEVLRRLARAAEQLVSCDICGVLDDVDDDHGDDEIGHVKRDPDPTEVANWLSACADDLEAGRE